MIYISFVLILFFLFYAYAIKNENLILRYEIDDSNY
ncbi:Uncharacterised protein [[Clostridium] sordellii]|nr:Uncharacterised protein [[Clostridium] sordellii] [Paeniclostridium sordellii]CEN94395.1 Uncharacterised protein [[Clostridium] sordellii] [Paeniclostridium sordellii]